MAHKIDHLTQLISARQHRHRWTTRLQTLLDLTISTIAQTLETVDELPSVWENGWTLAWARCATLSRSGNLLDAGHELALYRIAFDPSGIPSAALVANQIHNDPADLSVELPIPSDPDRTLRLQPASRTDILEAAVVLPQLVHKLIEALRTQGDEAENATRQLKSELHNLYPENEKDEG